MDSAGRNNFLGEWIRPASANVFSRPQEGSGEECGRDSLQHFFCGIRGGHTQLHYMAIWNNTQWNTILTK